MSARAHRVASRPRAAPRRRVAPRRRSRIQWDRLGRIVLVIVLFVIALSYINPVVNFLDAWRDSDAERTQLNELKQENTALQARRESLRGGETAETGARELGMIAPGERSYVIRGLSD